MDIKLLKSKINLLSAQLSQFNDSGLFTDEEILRFATPLKVELGKLMPVLEELQAKVRPEDFEVNGAVSL